LTLCPLLTNAGPLITTWNTADVKTVVSNATELTELSLEAKLAMKTADDV